MARVTSSDKKLTALMQEQPKAPKVGVAQYVRNIKMEMAKVTWPTRKETMTTTMMVFIMVVFTSIFFFIVDQLLSYGIRLILGFGA